MDEVSCNDFKVLMRRFRGDDLETHDDPHTTFFCTPHDAGVVKDAKF